MLPTLGMSTSGDLTTPSSPIPKTEIEASPDETTIACYMITGATLFPDIPQIAFSIPLPLIPPTPTSGIQRARRVRRSTLTAPVTETESSLQTSRIHEASRKTTHKPKMATHVRTLRSRITSIEIPRITFLTKGGS